MIKNEELVRDAMQIIWNECDVSRVSEFYSDDFKADYPHTDWGTGLEGVCALATQVHNDLPGYTEDIEQLTVIFPNTSEPFSGGNLEPGTTVHLGKIKPNQVVGFFQVARGWSQKLTKGIYTHYSDYETGSPQHSVLLHDQKRNSLIIAFEDIKLPYGDKDFNDVIVKVFSYPEDALKTDALPKIN